MAHQHFQELKFLRLQVDRLPATAGFAAEETRQAAGTGVSYVVRHRRVTRARGRRRRLPSRQTGEKTASEDSRPLARTADSKRIRRFGFLEIKHMARLINSKGKENSGPGCTKPWPEGVDVKRINLALQGGGDTLADAVAAAGDQGLGSI